jgi:hypothetical protein
MIIFLALLSLPKETFAQRADANEQPVPSLKDDPLNIEEGNPVEPDELTRGQSSQDKENPLSLKEVDDTTTQDSTQEGIQDAFSRDRGDRFSGKK